MTLHEHRFTRLILGPDHLGAVWSGFIEFASMIKYSLKCIWIYAADVKSRQHFRTKKIGGIRVTEYQKAHLSKNDKDAAQNARIPSAMFICYLRRFSESRSSSGSTPSVRLSVRPSVRRKHFRVPSLFCARFINFFSFLRGVELRHFFHQQCLGGA